MTKVMKKRLILTLVLLVVFLPASIIAFQNEPDSFRGIKWEIDIGKLPEFKKINDRTYEKKNDKLKIGDADLDKILYGSYKGRFYTVTIFYNNPINYLTLKDVLFGLYGKVKQVCPLPNLQLYVWHGKNVNIDYDYDLEINKGSLRYVYLPISKQASQDTNKRIKGAASDF